MQLLAKAKVDVRDNEIVVSLQEPHIPVLRTVAASLEGGIGSRICRLHTRGVEVPQVDECLAHSLQILEVGLQGVGIGRIRKPRIIYEIYQIDAPLGQEEVDRVCPVFREGLEVETLAL